LAIPEFDNSGNLPPGIHRATWPEFERRFGWNGHRKELMKGMKAALISFKSAGCQWVYLDGSFVSNKDLSEDWDGCWDPRGVDPTAVDPILLDVSKSRERQKLKFMGEMLPAYNLANSSGRIILDFFQTDRQTGQPKGIVAINLKDIKP
jgi:hypothetical protein